MSRIGSPHRPLKPSGQARELGARVIAIGTTVVRALEHAAAIGPDRAGRGRRGVTEN